MTFQLIVPVAPAVTRAPVCEDCRTGRHHRCTGLLPHEGDPAALCICPPAFHRDKR